jgi:hypothetical protein
MIPPHPPSVQPKPKLNSGKNLKQNLVEKLNGFVIDFRLIIAFLFRKRIGC